MDLEENEAWIDYAGEGQQQFSRPAYCESQHLSYLWGNYQPVRTCAGDDVEIHYQAMANEGVEDLASAVVRSRVHELVRTL
jgi:hypothetical protein